MLRFSYFTLRHGMRSKGIEFRTFCSIEQWKEVPGYPNYHVSTLGKIKNIKRNKELFINYERFAFQNKRPKITLCSNGQTKFFSISRIILMTFNPVDDCSILPRLYKLVPDRSILSGDSSLSEMFQAEFVPIRFITV